MLGAQCALEMGFCAGKGGHPLASGSCRTSAKGGRAHASASDHTEPGHPQLTPRRGRPHLHREHELYFRPDSCFSLHLQGPSFPSPTAPTDLCTTNRPGPNGFNLPWPWVLHSPQFQGIPRFPLTNPGQRFEGNQRNSLNIKKRAFPPPLHPT